MKKTLILIFVTLFCSCKNTKDQSDPSNTNVNSNISIQKEDNSLGKLETRLTKLKYNLHPYSGYPLFSGENNKDYYYAITVLAKDEETKDRWVFDETTYSDKLATEIHKYILENRDDYIKILLYVDNNLYNQEGNYSPSENFNYKIYFDKNDSWYLKKEGKFEQDFFIFLDTFFPEEIRKI